MKCPYCGVIESKVIDKRENNDQDTTRRRRECLSCRKRYTTYERVEMANITVVKKDGRREIFVKEKILKGLQRACEKRPISAEDINTIVDEIENEARNLEKPEVNSKILGELIMGKLRKLDDVAYVRFASVYRQFKDVNEFLHEIKTLSSKLEKGVENGA